MSVDLRDQIGEYGSQLRAERDPIDMAAVLARAERVRPVDGASVPLPPVRRWRFIAAVVAAAAAVLLIVGAPFLLRSAEPASPPATTDSSVTSTTANNRSNTTTTWPEGAFVKVSETFITNDGYGYKVTFASWPDSPEESLLGCVDAAPPGMTNVFYTMTISPQALDRTSPSPRVIVSSNVADGGVPQTGVDPFAAELRLPRDIADVEISPNVESNVCRQANTLDFVEDSLDPGSVSKYVVVVGPVVEDSTHDVVVALRLFTGTYEYIGMDYGPTPRPGG